MSQIGIKLANHDFFPIIDESESLPVSKELELTTAKDGQATVQINLFRKYDSGEEAFVGSLVLEDLKKVTSGEATIALKLEMDERRHLQASAVDVDGGAKQSFSIDVDRLNEGNFLASDFDIEDPFQNDYGGDTFSSSLGEVDEIDLSFTDVGETEGETGVAEDSSNTFLNDDSIADDSFAGIDLTEFDGDFDDGQDDIAERDVLKDDVYSENEVVVDETGVGEGLDGTATDDFSFDGFGDVASSVSDSSFDETGVGEGLDEPATDDFSFDGFGDAASSVSDSSFDETGVGEGLDEPAIDDFSSDDFSMFPDSEPATTASLENERENEGEEEAYTEENTDLTPAPEVSSNYYEEMDEDEEKSGFPTWLKVFVVLLIFCLLALVGWLIFKNMVKSDKMAGQDITLVELEEDSQEDNDEKEIDSIDSLTTQAPTKEREPFKVEDSLKEAKVEAVQEVNTEGAEKEEAVKEESPPEPVAQEKSKQEVKNVGGGAIKKSVRYRVRLGDTLWDLSEAFYKTPWKYKKIAQYNGIKNPSKIIVNQVITIPAK